MKKLHGFIALGVVLLFVSGACWASDRSDVKEAVPAILASLDQNNVTMLDEPTIKEIRGQAQYRMVKIIGINTWDYSCDWEVRWTWNPFRWRYGNFGGPGYSGGDGSGPVDLMDSYFETHDSTLDNEWLLGHLLLLNTYLILLWLC